MTKHAAALLANGVTPRNQRLQVQLEMTRVLVAGRRVVVSFAQMDIFSKLMLPAFLGMTRRLVAIKHAVASIV